MSSTEQDVGSNDNSDKDRAITKPSEGTYISLLNTDNDVTVDEELAEDQEMEDSYVFVEADYHSYSDVESSVAEGSSSSCELPEREEEKDPGSKSDSNKMEEQNGGVRRGFVKKTAEKTPGAEGSDSKDDGIDLPDIVKTLLSLFLRSINGTDLTGLSRESWRRKPGVREE
ncbi:uncharacterized protein J4E92_008842 [Alternaria infectoria]|uniref:uncharacterized protein n=1 Tax=Alternaria infectoria TaxID=45303 RepID=UPI0022211BE3|nr:uncharacterized protein J4E92_008842 [Alternaria infectoria]KAI4917904.1 hypothetical protein J4E92_008842 [Alternaria infectoria]